MQILIRFVVFACMALVPGLALAGVSPLAPGTWKIRVEVPGLPASAEAMMARMTPEVCIRPGMTHPPMSPQAQADRCHIVHTAVEGSRITSTVSCLVRGQVTTVRSVMEVGPGGKSYVQHNQVLKGPGAQMGRTTVRGKWVGSQCPAAPAGGVPSYPAPAESIH